MEDNKNNLPNDDDNKSVQEVFPEVAPYHLKRVKEHGVVLEWIINLFKGYWYGLTDLFLASWVNIVMLALIVIVPLVYGVISVLAYWSPMSNLGKMPTAIFDEDTTFLKVEDSSKDNSGNYSYHVGALDSYSINGGEQKTVTADNLDDSINAIKTGSNVKLTLNNGFVVNYNPVDVKLAEMNTWDTIKNTLLVKKDANKSDTDSKYKVAFVPDPKLNFRNISYVNDKSKIDKNWQTGNYGAQFKIDNGYGKTLVGMTGIALDSNFQTEVAQAQIGKSALFGTDKTSIASNLNNAVSFTNSSAIDKMPKVNLFTTYERQFLSQYILGSVLEFKDSIIQQTAPILNALNDNYTASQTFGTSREELIDAINTATYTKDGEALSDEQSASIKNLLLSKLPSNVSDNANSTLDDYFMVLSKNDFETSLNEQLAPTKISLKINDSNLDSNTLFGTDGSDGTVGKWINEYQYFVKSPAYQSLYPESNGNLLFLNKIIAKMPNDTTLPNALKTMLTKTTINANQGSNVVSLLKAYKEVMGPALGKEKAEAQIPFATLPAFTYQSRDGTWVPIDGKDGKIALPFIPSFKFKDTDGKVNNGFNMFSLASGLMSAKDMVNNKLISNEENYFPFFDSVKALGAPLTINLLGDAYTQMVAKVAVNGTDTSKLLNVQEQRGSNKALYGIGLGSMMIFVGFYVGFTVLRSVIKPTKQYAKLVGSNWYISKFLMYATVGFFQVTIATWIIYGIEWHNEISAGVMALEWIWMLLGALVIISIIIGLQYALNPGIGSILAIFYLCLNVSSGGGSYPGWMEMGFFHGISYVLPFTYSLAGMDQLSFGVNIVGATSSSTDFLLTYWGYLTCFFAFFFLIGMLGSRKAMRTTMFGTGKGKSIYNALVILKRDKQASNFRQAAVDKNGENKTNKKGLLVYKYNWKALSPLGDPAISEAVKMNIHKKIMFKWYAEQRKKRHLDELDLLDRINDKL